MRAPYLVIVFVFVTLVCTLGLTLPACGEKQDPVQHSDGGGADGGPPVTWCDGIDTIITQSCAVCHSASLQGTDRNGAPVSINFDSYADTVDNLDRANTNIQAGTMPPSAGLDPADRTLFQQWVDQSTPACD